MTEELFGSLGESISEGNWFMVAAISVILLGILLYFLQSLDIKSPNDF